MKSNCCSKSCRSRFPFNVPASNACGSTSGCVFENDRIHVYSLDSVLNLSPFNTRILFYNVKDLNHSRLSCSDSLTNKLGDHFKFDLCKGDFNLAYLSGLNIHVEDTCKNYDAKVLQNNKLNVVKGFILGFYLGISKFCIL